MENNLEELVYSVISVQSKPISLNMIAKKLNKDREIVKNVIDKLRLDGKIIFMNNKYSLFPKDNYIGTVCISTTGNKLIFSETGKIPVRVDDVNSLVAEDIVSYKLDSHKEAMITSIIKREIDTMICEVKIIDGKKKLLAYRKDIHPVIDNKILKTLVDGDIIKVSNTIPDDIGYAHCNFIAKLGNIKDPTIMQKAILESNGIETGYSEEYMEELSEIPNEIDINEHTDRIDNTNIPFTTIDNDDTMDIDDGLYAYELEDGKIHVDTFLIPIPSLVKYEGEIYSRAYKKQFTTYFSNSCDPLYHPKISNGIGSLNEGELRLTTTGSYEIDKDGKILNPRFVRSLGVSRKKMNYSSVDKVLNNEEIKEYDPYRKVINTLYKAAMYFKDGSTKRGRIDYPSRDLDANILDNGIVEYVKKERTKASELVEFLMIPTNIAWIEYFNSLGIYLLPYRCHDKINSTLLNYYVGKYNDKIKKINVEIKKLRKNNWEKKLKDGTIIKVHERELEKYLPYVNSKNASKEIGMYMEKLEEPLKTKYINLVYSCTPYAYYSVENIGHDALKEEKYAQTTADIRRMIDGIYHFLLDKLYEDEHWLDKNYLKFYDMLVDMCKIATTMERRTDNASHDELVYNMLKSLEPFIGNEFTGIITSLGNNTIKIKFNEIDGYVDYNSLDENFLFDNSKKLFYDKNNFKYLKEGEKIIFTLEDIYLSNLSYSIKIHGIKDELILKKEINRN